MVEFTNSGGRRDIFIDIGSAKNLEKGIRIIDNIEKAIKIKYDINKFKDLFDNETIESIDLDVYPTIK